MGSISNGVKIGKAVVKWRESASLIILAKNNLKSKNDADFKVLLFGRPEKASFMPTSSAFPGGVRESADESLLWLKHFQNFGIKQGELNKLILPRSSEISPQPKIFETENEERIHKDISLRITAIRETFEEMGILLCSDRNTFTNLNGNPFASFNEDFDRKYWQHLVHNKPEEFLNLCQELKVMPDLWNLNEWSVWRTPAAKPKRFETAFYMATLKCEPNVLLEENEAVDYKWYTPKEALLQNLNGNIFLPTPQLYELTRLLNFNELAELQAFVNRRACEGTMLMLPVQNKCNNGMVSLLPGDSDYPCDPDSATKLKNIDLSMSDYRSKAEKLHRIEFSKIPIGDIYLNFDPIDGHKRFKIVKPLDD